MKKILALLVCLISSSAWAGVPCSVPFQLQNNTVADATQVMANYNALITCLGNAASAGANNDITSLNALASPISPAQGGTQMYVGGTSTGAANGQIVSTVIPSSFPSVAGNQVTFIAGISNTGPMFINVASTGNRNLFRRTQLGISAMTGGEIVAGHPVTMEFDGVQFICLTCGPYLVGEIRDYAGSTSPAGWAFIDGSCAVRTTFADLFTVIGTAYDPTGSTCDGAHFALPDGRGRVMAGQDTLGTRITSAGSGCNGAVLGGAGCGVQAVAIAQNQLPNISPTFTGSAMGNHSHDSGGNGPFVTFGAGPGQLGGSGIAIGQPTNTGSASAGTPAGSVSSINGGVTQVGTPILPPLQIVNKIIKL